MCIYRPRPGLSYDLCDKAIYTNSMYSAGDGPHTKPYVHHLLQRLQDVQLEGDAASVQPATSVRPACDAVYVARASKRHCWSIEVSLGISIFLVGHFKYLEQSIFGVELRVSI